MPLMRCKSEGQSGWKYGDSGKCYIGPGAKAKAMKQAAAIKASQSRNSLTKGLKIMPQVIADSAAVNSAPPQVDFIYPNGHGGLAVTGGNGGVAARLMASNFDPNVLRPYIGNNGRPYITRFTKNAQGKIVPQAFVTNAPATLRRDEWKMLDDAVVRAAITPTRAWSDLRGANQFVMGNGMAKTVLEYQTQGDTTDATVSMDGVRAGDADRPHYDFRGLPLPIIHKDFQFTARELAISRNGSTPLDTTMAELSSRKVSEMAEKFTLGVVTFGYAGYSVYGYTNFPFRLTKTLTAPTSANHATTIAEILDMKKKSTDAGFFGPWILYASPAWDLFLDEDYLTTKGDNTLRERILDIEGITDVRTAYFLTGTTLVLVQMTPDVARAVVGMEITTVQWEELGGMLFKFKVMSILVPQLRANTGGQTGIVHGNV